MTTLSPLEEALFNSWARAHGVYDHDDPNNRFDYRGLYKQTNGMLQPGHVVRSMAQNYNLATEPQDAVEQPDPYMAAAEMHGNMVKAQSDQAKDQMKLKIEQMKLEHKSMEAEKDREFKREQVQQQLALKMQMQQQQAEQRAQQQQMMNEQRMQQQQASMEGQLQSRMLDEHLTRTRPEPAMGPSGGGDLQSVLTNRAMGDM